MKIHRFVLGQLQTNCYLVVCLKTNEGIVIDPADEGSFISEKILSIGLKPKFIVLTHGHFDHLMAAEELRLNFQVPILLHQEDMFLLEKAYQSANYFSIGEKFLIPKEVKFVKEGEKIKFGQERLEVIHTPGHTPGSVALYNKKRGVLFGGDLIFKEGFGRTDFSYSSAEKLQDSLRKIFSLPPETLIYPGHGEEFFLKEVVKYCQK